MIQKSYTMRNMKLKNMIFFTCLNRYRNCRNDENRIEMVEARTAFKKSVRHFWYECKKTKNKTFIRSEIQKCKVYWKLLKDSQHSDSSTSLSANKFHNYFKAINDPNTVFYQADEDILHFNDRFFKSEIQIMFAELDAEISEEEIVKAIKMLNSGKSGGPDRLLNKFLFMGLLHCQNT